MYVGLPFPWKCEPWLPFHGDGVCQCKGKWNGEYIEKNKRRWPWAPVIREKEEVYPSFLSLSSNTFGEKIPHAKPAPVKITVWFLFVSRVRIWSSRFGEPNVFVTCMWFWTGYANHQDLLALDFDVMSVLSSFQYVNISQACRPSDHLWQSQNKCLALPK